MINKIQNGIFVKSLLKDIINQFVLKARALFELKLISNKRSIYRFNLQSTFILTVIDHSTLFLLLIQ